MILTVTPDPVLDQVLLIDEWLPGEVMHAAGPATSVGGKGLDASVALRHLGVDTTALCYLAGTAGQQLYARLQAYGIDCAPVWAEGETRTAYVLAERAHGRHSHVFCGGVRIHLPHQDRFLSLFQEKLPGAEWLVAGGVFPADLQTDFYAWLTTLAHRHCVPVLLDAHTRFIEPALAAHPEIIKMNRREFENTFHFPAPDLEALAGAARQVYRERRLNALVITCGAEGILAFCPEGAFHACPPPQPVVSAAGAGDAASAALAWRLGRGDTWPEALRWAAAAGAAVVLTPGTADLHMQDVQRILKEVRVEPLPANGKGSA